MMPGLPFGGTGESGYGGYHGKRCVPLFLLLLIFFKGVLMERRTCRSFDTFTHERAAASVPTWMDTAMAARYPPYTRVFLFFLPLLSRRLPTFPSPSFPPPPSSTSPLILPLHLSALTNPLPHLPPSSSLSLNRSRQAPLPPPRHRCLCHLQTPPSRR